MGGIDVASVVASIISAFGSGLEVFHRLSGKKRKTSARPPRPWEEEEWIQDSLKSRPLQIQQEYDHNVVKFGHRFEVGDSTAHSTLAHTLLVLNTGLINLINHALSTDPHSKAMSQKALFTLSETAALDTLAALGQLQSRLSLSVASTPRLPLEPKERQKFTDNATQMFNDKKSQIPHSRKGSSASLSKTSKRPSPAPLLVRGGWVRSKSGSLIISAATARKIEGSKEARGEKVKGAKTEKHIRSQSNPSNISSSASPQDSHTRKRSDDAENNEADFRGTYKAGDRQPQRRKTSQDCRPEEHPPFQRQRQTSDTNPRPQRQPSMLIVPADFFDTPATGMQVESVEPPPRPPKIPLDTRPRLRHGHNHGNGNGNARPSSTMTFMTASTKIGEIPASRWPDGVVSTGELGSRRPAYVVPPPLETAEPKKKKGLKFWKRECKRQEIAA
ncbi:hypothetical protein A1O1_05576 [Capronia coronata CBS 617.96]|uniref:Uncharacterized protein n=1 Tax=Capronia coronata CBS 617.96 TaxID=1182541 RepID=W9YG40_9EURO|nr:uncharacterized protein A1O1_05576 [Capronia coronata CBS 617.96]EXJ88645.1 hypothetical protein A1O1_05576 [Capronia coronata CBS 617.96]